MCHALPPTVPGSSQSATVAADMEDSCGSSELGVGRSHLTHTRSGEARVWGRQQAGGAGGAVGVLRAYSGLAGDCGRRGGWVIHGCT